VARETSGDLFEPLAELYSLVSQPGPGGPLEALDVMRAEAARLFTQEVTHPITVPASGGGAAPIGAPLAATLPSQGGDSGNLALNKPARQSSARYPGSQGGVDGIKNGQFGFHTEEEPNAWWDVDLQHTVAISEVRVFNRRDNADRARTLQVLLSQDGATWTRVYAHGGSIFGADGQPLRIPLNGAVGRWVRLQLAESNFLQLNSTDYLHLDEVEVLGWIRER
jgi:hypothetical protein